jgi:hypothetical protein
LDTFPKVSRNSGVDCVHSEHIEDTGCIRHALRLCQLCTFGACKLRARRLPSFLSGTVLAIGVASGRLGYDT